MRMDSTRSSWQVRGRGDAFYKARVGAARTLDRQGFQVRSLALTYHGSPIRPPASPFMLDQHEPAANMDTPPDDPRHIDNMRPDLVWGSHTSSRANCIRWIRAIHCTARIQEYTKGARESRRGF